MDIVPRCHVGKQSDNLFFKESELLVPLLRTIHIWCFNFSARFLRCSKGQAIHPFGTSLIGYIALLAPPKIRGAVQAASSFPYTLPHSLFLSLAHVCAPRHRSCRSFASRGCRRCGRRIAPLCFAVFAGVVLCPYVRVSVLVFVSCDVGCSVIVRCRAASPTVIMAAEIHGRVRSRCTVIMVRMRRLRAHEHASGPSPRPDIFSRCQR